MSSSASQTSPNVASAQDKWTQWEKARDNNKSRPQLPPEIKKLVDQADQLQKAFRERQTALRAQLKDATADQRDQLKDELKNNLEQFKARQEAVEQQLKDRLQEIRHNFNNDLDKALNQAKGEGKKSRGCP